MEIITVSATVSLFCMRVLAFCKNIVPHEWRPPRRAWRRTPVSAFIYTFMLLPIAVAHDMCNICCWIQVPVIPIGILWIYYINYSTRYEILGDHSMPQNITSEYYERPMNRSCVSRTPVRGLFPKTIIVCPTQKQNFWFTISESISSMVLYRVPRDTFRFTVSSIELWGRILQTIAAMTHTAGNVCVALR